MNYISLYSTTLIFSFVMTLIFYLFHSRYWNPDTHIPIQIIYFLNMTSALLCVVWVIVDGKPNLIPINYIANIIEFNCMGFCGYFWLSYCLKFVDIPILKTKWAKFLMLAPILIIMCLIITTPLTHWAFYIDEGGYFQRGIYYPIQQTGYLYLLISSAICLCNRKKCTTSSERRRLGVLAMFPLSPAIFGGIQIIAPSGGAPTLQFSIVISLILVFIDELDQKITRDSLTQLKNRYEFERILQNKIRAYQKNDPKLYVLMFDVDNFKSINDNYGHQQGDSALIMISNILSKIALKYDAICARMGGDEFFSLIETDSPNTVTNFQEDLIQALKDACLNLPYTIEISIGTAEYDGNMNLIQLLNEADLKMYIQKKLRKNTEE